MTDGAGPVLQPSATSLDGARPLAVADSDVALAAGGDAAAFERLYRAHAPKVYALTRRMAGADRAEELTQDAFVRAWQKLHTFRGEASFGTWLHRLTVNVVVERFRTLGVERARFLDDGEETLARVPGERQGARLDAGMDLEAAVAQLPPGARAVFVLHDVEGYRHEEIGTLLGVSVGTSKSQLHRARMALRGHLTRRKEAS